MKRRCKDYMILVAVLMLIQQIISGCTAPMSKDLYIKELHREEEELVGKKLYKDKCSLCHELPDVDAYPYTPDQWASIIDIMHDTKAARKFMTLEDTEKIKVYLRRLSQTR